MKGTYSQFTVFVVQIVLYLNLRYNIFFEIFNNILAETVFQFNWRHSIDFFEIDQFTCIKKIFEFILKLFIYKVVN